MVSLETFKDHLINVVAGAAILGGAAAIVDNKVDTARLDQRLIAVEKLNNNVETLTRELALTREQLARMEGPEAPAERKSN